MGILGCLTSQIAGCILYLINSIFISVGIAIGALGCVLHFGGNAVYQAFSGLLGQIASINIGGSQVQLGITDLQKILGSWSGIVSYAGLVLLGLGLFFVAIGILGCIGACCKLKILLIVYVVLTLAITLTLIGFVIGYYVFKQNMKDFGAQEMRKLVASQYKGSWGPYVNDFSKVLDIIQGKLGCCGVSNYTEFNAADWNRTYLYSQAVGYITLVAPVSCCKLNLVNAEPINKNCTFNPTPENSNFQVGCYEKLWNFLDSYANVLIVGIAITAAVTGAISVLVIIMLCYHFQNDITPI